MEQEWGWEMGDGWMTCVDLPFQPAISVAPITEITAGSGRKRAVPCVIVVHLRQSQDASA